jgi:branched-chain amino acid transport system permease protein
VEDRLELTRLRRWPGLIGARWRNRHRIWWSFLGRCGLTEARWKGFRPWQRRAVKIGAAGALLLVILAPLYDFKPSAYILFAVVATLYVPEWGRSRVAVGQRVVRPGGFVLPVAVLAMIITYPFYLGHLPALPILGAFPSLPGAFVMAIYVMMALGLNIVVGYAGLLDLGYVAFYAIGAYSAGWLASPHAFRWGVHKTFTALGGVGVPSGVGGIHISIWLLLPVAALLAAIAGVIIGLPTLRLRGDYLAIVTLGFGEIVGVAANNGDHIAGANITNGPQGINPIDPPGFGGWLHTHLGFPKYFTQANGPTLNSTNLYFWAAIMLCLFVIFCSIRLRDSKLGRAWVAIREDETAAAAMGVPLMRTKTWAYAIGAFMGGMAGCFLKSQQGGAFPGDFLFQFSILVLCMVILGGMGSIWGVILGGAFLAYLSQEGIGNISGWYNQTFGTNVDFTAYQYGIYGVILVLVMLFRPTGLVPSARRRAEFEIGVQDEPLMDVRAAPEA